MTCLTQTTLLLVSFLLYLLDQGTDAFTSLLFLLDVRQLQFDWVLYCIFRVTTWREDWQQVWSWPQAWPLVFWSSGLCGGAEGTVSWPGSTSSSVLSGSSSPTSSPYSTQGGRGRRWCWKRWKVSSARGPSWSCSWRCGWEEPSPLPCSSSLQITWSPSLIRPHLPLKQSIACRLVVLSVFGR